MVKNTVTWKTLLPHEKNCLIACFILMLLSSTLLVFGLAAEIAEKRSVAQFPDTQFFSIHMSALWDLKLFLAAYFIMLAGCLILIFKTLLRSEKSLSGLIDTLQKIIHEHDYSLRTVPNPQNKEAEHLALIINDLLQRIEIDRLELRAAYDQARETQQKLKTADAAKNGFLAIMSHEIRTPMNGVIGMTELLNETELNDEQKRYVGTILNSADTLLCLINDILDLSKIEAGRITLENIAFDLREELEASATLFAPEAQSKGVDFVFTYEEGLPRIVHGDPTRIKQIINNLLSNAVKFTEKGQITLQATKANRSAAEDKDSRNYYPFTITVSDTGIGIPQKIQGKIFDKFTQADASTTRQYGGTGLGLAICHKLSQFMGGALELQSEEGKGSSFSLHLPLLSQTDTKTTGYRQAYEADKTKGSTSSTATGNEDEKKHIKFSAPYILIAEDDPVNRELVSQLLLSLGCRIETAENGNLALDLLKTHKDFDLIMMDCEMPERNGFETTKEIQHMIERGEIRDIPVIALTAHVMNDIRLKCLSYGMRDYLPKPLRKDAIIDTLQRWLPQHRKAESLPAFRGFRVLITDDNPTNLDIAGELLKQIGFDVHKAENGEIAVNMAAQLHYDLMIMDIEMPVMDGLEATRILRTMMMNGIIAETPIIALTAHNTDEMRQKCLNTGMQDFLTKPVRRDMLERCISCLDIWQTPDISFEQSPSNQDEISPADQNEIFAQDIFNAYQDIMGEQTFKGVDLYLTETEKLIALLKEDWTAEVLGTLNRHAHSLRSSSATIGAIALSNYAEIIEKQTEEMLDSQDYSFVPDQSFLNDMEDCFLNTKKQIEDYMR